MADERESAGEVLPSTCLKCRRLVFTAQCGGMAGGGPLMFDLVGEGAGRMLLVHGCCFDDDDEDDGPDPEEGWEGPPY